MDIIKVNGGVPLKGVIEIGGAKNAALPLMAASILTKECLSLSNIPYLADITTMAALLVNFGVSFTVDGSSEDGGHTGRVLSLSASDIIDTTAPYDIVRKMRASIVVLGPLLARFGHAKVSLPGGCAIGTRPVDFHLSALEKMGTKITIDEGYINASVDGKLKGAEIEFPVISVGATENIMMAATLADGQTIIKNAAREPEIADLAHCLNKMGADISGIDTHTLIINGVDELHGAYYSVLPDRIEAGTYAIAAAITGGEIELTGISTDILHSTIDMLEKAGVTIIDNEDSIIVRAGKSIKPLNISTAPYPDFATDMQAQFMALICLAEGTSTIQENIFENRYMHVPELQRMGANIHIEGNIATIEGVAKLKAAEVMATDLRASVSLVLAALTAEGETIINRVYHIDRGYERIEEKLSSCGAKIERMRG